LDNFLHAPVQDRKIEIWGEPAESAELAEIIDRKFGGMMSLRNILLLGLVVRQLENIGRQNIMRHY